MIPYILTYTGNRFKHSEIKPEDINIEDIAHSLSLVCRFGGHCREFYSVAQHSVLVSYYCLPEDAFEGLMHDASEAYCGDMCSPLKKLHSMYEYRALENDIMTVISQKFNFRWPEPANVKYTDLVLLATEGRDLFNTDEHFGPMPTLAYTIEPWEPKHAESMFLKTFDKLSKERNEKEKRSQAA